MSMQGDEKMINIYKDDAIQEGIKALAGLMKESNYIIVLTGAGMDTESNIPDFRGKDGLWRKIDPRLVASVDTLEENYSMFREFYIERINRLKGVNPHEGHYILADFEEKGIIKSIATQNVSALHELAGSKNVNQLHGNIRSIRCNNCNKEANIDDFINNHKCEFCGSNILRPDVVLFGESLPAGPWNQAQSDIRKSDLLIVIGTSLEVSPVNQLPLLTRGKRALINNEDVYTYYDFDIKLIGKAKDILIRLRDTYNKI